MAAPTQTRQPLSTRWEAASLNSVFTFCSMAFKPPKDTADILLVQTDRGLGIWVDTFFGNANFKLKLEVNSKWTASSECY